MATPMLWTRQPDTIGVLGLALNARRARTGTARRPSRSASCCSPRATSGARCPELDDDADVIQTGRAAFRLIHVADILAVTAGT